MGDTVINAYIFAGAICASIAAASLFLYTPMGEMSRNSRTSLMLFFAYFPVIAVGFLLLSVTQIMSLPLYLMQSVYYCIVSLAGWLLFSGLSWRRNTPFNLLRSRLFICNAVLWLTVIITQIPSVAALYEVKFIYIVTLGTLNILTLTIMCFYILKDRELKNVGEQLFAINLILRLLMSIAVFVVYNLSQEVNLFYANIAVSSIITTVLTIGSVYCMFLFDRINKHKSEAETDYLTGLLNRRAFMEKMTQKEESLFFQKNPGAIVVCDIDKFKSINDNYGHDVGDLAIQKLATVLTKSLRDNDMCARMGGEEFALFIADANNETTYSVVDRIRQNIEKSELVVGEKVIQFTASFGFAMLDREKSLSAHLKEADHAMYEAKHKGRNRVFEFSESSLAVIEESFR